VVVTNPAPARVATVFAPTPSAGTKSRTWLVSAALTEAVPSVGQRWSASNAMKIVMTTTSPNLDSDVDPRFGRCAYLLVMDTDSLKWQAHPNPGVNVSGGAGIKAAQFVTEQKVEAVLSGDFGPHAFQALQAAGIAMHLYGDCCTTRQAIEHFKAGQLQQVGAPTRDDCDHGHHEQGV
jgi:predicted Fe-Mo cluster-binding NifX family protein